MKGGPVTLPSGIVVRIQRARLLSLAASGKIPNSLLTVAVKVANDGEILTKEEAEELAPDERAKKQADADLDTERLVNAVVCAVMVEPKVVATEDEEQEASVWVGRLDPIDKRAIYFYAQYPQSSWDTFRQQFGLPAV